MDLSEEEDGFLDLLLELEIVVEVSLDLVKRKIDEHAGDLGCSLFSDEALNELVDELANELLQVRVVGDNNWHNLESLNVVGSDERIGVDQGTLGVLDHNLSGCSLRGRLGNWNLVELSGVSLTLVLVLVLTSLVYSRTSVSTEVVLLVLTGLSVVESWLLSIVQLAVRVVVLTVVATLVRESSAHLSLDKEEDLLDQLDGVGASEEGWVKRASTLSLEVHEVSLILGISLLLLADLGELVVGNVEELSVDCLGLVELSAGIGCIVG